MKELRNLIMFIGILSILVGIETCKTSDENPQLPMTPSNLQGKAETTRQISLEWDDNSNNEIGFKIQRKKIYTSYFIEIASVGVDVKSYQDQDLQPGTWYYYRVYAYNDAGNSVFSNQVDIRTPGGGVYSRGRVNVCGICHCDLDTGDVYQPVEEEDFWWDIRDHLTRYIVPRNNAKFCVLGIRDFSAVTYSELSSLSYSNEEINGSKGNSNQIPEGTVVAYITSEGRLGKFCMNDYGYDITIDWVTYN